MLDKTSLCIYWSAILLHRKFSRSVALLHVCLHSFKFVILWPFVAYIFAGMFGHIWNWPIFGLNSIFMKVKDHKCSRGCFLRFSCRLRNNLRVFWPHYTNPSFDFLYDNVWIMGRAKRSILRFFLSTFWTWNWGHVTTIAIINDCDDLLKPLIFPIDQLFVRFVEGHFWVIFFADPYQTKDRDFITGWVLLVNSTT